MAIPVDAGSGSDAGETKGSDGFRVLGLEASYGVGHKFAAETWTDAKLCYAAPPIGRHTAERSGGMPGVRVMLALQAMRQQFTAP
jgi:hypothetical protein